MNDTRPIIVAIEGADGSGKTRHVQAAVESLGRAGYKARAFHHAAPPESERNPLRAALWYAEKRREFVQTLCAGDVTIADRWFWSTLALRNGLIRDPSTPTGDMTGTRTMREIAEEEADALHWSRVATQFDDVLPAVRVNDAAPRATVRMALVVLDAPDAVLDARLAAREEPLPSRRHGERAFYRRATCVDTSGETADLIVPRLVRWAVDGLRMGAL